MIKKLFYIFLVFLALVAAYNILNFLGDTEVVEPFFSLKDFTDMDIKPEDNAYYTYLALCEPEELNIESTRIIINYKYLGSSNMGYPMPFNAIRWRVSMNSSYAYNYYHGTRYGKSKFYTDILPVEKCYEDITCILKYKDVIEETYSHYYTYIKRLKIAIDKPDIQEFINTPQFSIINRMYSRILMIYSDHLIIEMRKGNIENASNEYLRFLDFLKRFMISSRGSWVWNASLYTQHLRKWTNLCLEHDIPAYIIQSSIKTLEETRKQNLNYKNYIVAEYLNYLSFHRDFRNEGQFDVRWSRLFAFPQSSTQYNRTLSYVNGYFKKLDESIRKPVLNQIEDEKLTDGFFWWLMNPGGKRLIEGFKEQFPIPDYKFIASAEIDISLLSLKAKIDGVKSSAMNTWLQQQYKNGYVNPLNGNAYEWDSKTNRILHGRDDEPYKRPE